MDPHSNSEMVEAELANLAVAVTLMAANATQLVAMAEQLRLLVSSRNRYQLLTGVFVFSAQPSQLEVLSYDVHHTHNLELSLYKSDVDHDPPPCGLPCSQPHYESRLPFLTPQQRSHRMFSGTDPIHVLATVGRLKHLEMHHVRKFQRFPTQTGLEMRVKAIGGHRYTLLDNFNPVFSCDFSTPPETALFDAMNRTDF